MRSAIISFMCLAAVWWLRWRRGMLGAMRCNKLYFRASVEHHLLFINANAWDYGNRDWLHIIAAAGIAVNLIWIKSIVGAQFSSSISIRNPFEVIKMDKFSHRRWFNYFHITFCTLRLSSFVIRHVAFARERTPQNGTKLRGAVCVRCKNWHAFRSDKMRVWLSLSHPPCGAYNTLR